MSRRLSAHERALWGRVSATIRPLHPAAPPPASPAPAPAKPAPTVRVKLQPPPPPPARVPPAKAPPPLAATLDAGWDKRLRQGRHPPDRIIDLHDHTLDRAHAALRMAIDMAAIDGDRVLLIITGKGRTDRPGRIRAELADWLQASDLRPRIAALRPASPRHGGGDAFYLILRRSR